MGTLKIRRSEEADIGRIMEIYAFARGFMKDHGNPNQWGPTNWPPEALIRDDIRARSSYACVNGEGKIVGTFYFICGQDIEPTYRQIEDGAWLDDSAYGVVHRLASDGSEKSVGQFCLDWAYEQCAHLRVDTHGDNRVMQNLLKKAGFVHCGTIYVVEDNYPRLAYEKSAETAARAALEEILVKQAESIVGEEPWYVAALSNVSALIMDSMEDLNWAGFYMFRDGQLTVGPFQGKPACIHIPAGKGVCGTCVERDSTIVVPNVHAFPGHIACDSASRSEIVIPIHSEGKIAGVLDIDSPLENRFSDAERKILEGIVKMLEENVCWNR